MGALCLRVERYGNKYPLRRRFSTFTEMFSGLQGPCSDAAGANPLLPWHTSVIFCIIFI